MYLKFNVSTNRTPGPKKSRGATVTPDVADEAAPSKSNLVNFRPVDAKEEGSDEDDDNDEEEDRRAADEKRLASERQAAEEMRLNELEQQRLRDAEAAEAKAARAREEEERRAREAESQKNREADLERGEDAKSAELTMNASQFKSLWSTMDPAGSFQCRLKMMPTISAFVDHMKRQVRC
jgi:septal ring factor EnvC (AmiA/AmiB activator)